MATLSHELEATSPNGPAAAARMAILWDEHDDLIRAADTPLRLAMKALSAVGRALRMTVPAKPSPG
ncbi:hypothetical protein BH24ACT23_BH24ACT23_08900 [soil metagenome]